MQIANFSCNLEGLTGDMVPPGYDILPYPVPSNQRQPDVQIAIWNNNIRFREEYFELLPHLELLINWGAHDANLPDQRLFDERSIGLKKVDSYSTQAVAEYIIAILLSYERKLMSISQRERPHAKEITGKKTGVIGLGKIGFCAADMLRSGFQNQIMYAATSDKKIDGMEYAPIPSILAENDYVIIAVKSKNFALQASDFDDVNRDLVMVNVSGPEVVPEAIIAPLLSAKRIRGYITDDRGQDPALAETVRINTPHIAYKTEESHWNKTGMLSFYLRKHHSHRSGDDRVYVMRHAHSSWNEMGLLQGRLDSGLSEQGVTQALAMARFLRSREIRTILTSPSIRAQETTSVIAKEIGAAVEIVPEFAAMDMGLFQGKPRGEMERLFQDFFQKRTHNKLYTRFPGGESYFDVYQRLLATTTRIAATKHHYGIVSHESINRVIRAILREGDLKEALHERQANNQIIECNMANDSETVHEV